MNGAKAGSGLFLHTDGFSKEDVELLLSVLDSKFGLQCNLRQRHKDQYAISISAHSREQFYWTHHHFSSSFYAISIYLE